MGFLKELLSEPFFWIGLASGISNVLLTMWVQKLIEKRR